MTTFLTSSGPLGQFLAGPAALALALLLPATPSQAAPCHLSWDAQAAGMRYQVWCDWKMLADVGEAFATVDLPDDRISTVLFRAYNPRGCSAFSAPFRVMPLVIRERGADLRSAKRLGVVFRALPEGEKQAFFDIAFPKP